MPTSRRTRKHARLGKDSNAQTWTTNREFQAEAEDFRRQRRLSEHSQGIGNRSLVRIARQLSRQLKKDDRQIAVFSDSQAKTLQGIKDGPLLAAIKVSHFLGEEVVASFASREELECERLRAHSVRIKVVASDGVTEKEEFNCVRLPPR